MTEKSKQYDYSDLKFVLIVLAIAAALIILPSKTEGGFIGTVQSVGDGEVTAIIKHTGEIVDVKASKDDIYSINEEVTIYTEDHIFYKRHVIR